MMYTFREFANLVGTTIRTLRYYEKIGLLNPIDHDGIKHIDASYVVTYQTIQLLKQVNYTLEQIKQLLQNQHLNDQLLMQKDLIKIQITSQMAMLKFLEEIEHSPVSDERALFERYLLIQNQEHLHLQFDDPSNLEYRIAFHHRYTTYPISFQQWLFTHYQFHKEDHVLEIGCGDGTLWLENQNQIPADLEITLSDVSYHMLEKSKENLKAISQIKSYDLANAYRLPYADQSFDKVIMNHVLMYLEDENKALQEVKRVLKPGGIFYCTTIAEDMMQERDALIRRFDPSISFDQSTLYKRFGNENGQLLLEKLFNSVQLFERKEVYTICDVDDYYHFILSGKGLSLHLEPLYKQKESFYQFLTQEYKKQGAFHLTIHTGLFEIRKDD